MGLDNISEIKKSVAFVFLIDDQQKVEPFGTGFFIRVPQEHNPQRAVAYFVTAKHVLQDDVGEYRSKIVIRLNGVDGRTSYTVLTLQNHKIFTHEDPNVDIAVIPISLNSSIIDFKLIPSEVVATKDKIKQLGIAEGYDVFFTGLFSSYVGQQRNQPITRFGKVALMPDERIEWKTQKDQPSKLMDLYLMECLSFSGNSGSPVFFNMAIGYLSDIYLAGIVMGSYHNIEIFAYDTFLKQNLGIVAVTPAYKLYDILFSKQVIDSRKITPK